jgi:hypothetical protein
MHEPEDRETIGLLRCHSCAAEQPQPDKFCRRCGASQRPGGARLTGDTERPAQDTRPLRRPHNYDSFSGALVTLVTEGVSARASSLSPSPAGNRWAMRLAGVLVAVPLWLMIVLLSPLDAYVATRAITKRV